MEEDLYYIVSIDIGVKHLGISLSTINKDFTFNEVVWFDLIDITDFLHTSEWKQCDCHLYHDKTFTDYLEHVFYIHSELFEMATWILLERQPPMGYVVVEQIIFGKYRNKSILISPNSMHCWMGWNIIGLDYETRKVYSCKFALKHIVRPYLLDIFNAMSRSHDIADSICMMMFFVDKKRISYMKDEKLQSIMDGVEDARAMGVYHTHDMMNLYRCD